MQISALYYNYNVLTAEQIYRDPTVSAIGQR